MEESYQSSQGYQSLSHFKWDCKYHVVFILQRRRKALFGQGRQHLGEIFHAVARQKECQILEGHLMADPVHKGIAIPPKHPVASVIGLLKGKSAIAVARQPCGQGRNFTGKHLWARGYAVSTVGFELEQVPQYLRAPEGADGSGGQFQIYETKARFSATFRELGRLPLRQPHSSSHPLCGGVSDSPEIFQFYLTAHLLFSSPGRFPLPMNDFWL